MLQLTIEVAYFGVSHKIVGWKLPHARSVAAGVAGCCSFIVLASARKIVGKEEENN